MSLKEMSEHKNRIKNITFDWKSHSIYIYVEVLRLDVLNVLKYKKHRPCGIRNNMRGGISLCILAGVPKYLGLHLFLNLVVLTVTHLQSSQY